MQQEVVLAILAKEPAQGSQLRARRPGAGWLRGRFLPSLGVAAFFCFLSFFDIPEQRVPLAQHFDFLYQVFRIDRWIQG